jgi:tRNA wybutosine-synthesizing protein 4
MRKGPTEVEVTSKQNKKLLLDIVNAHEAQSSGIQIGIKGAQIPRTIESSATLQTMARHTSLPVVIENFDLGPCTNLWTPEYLIEKVGPNKPTIIHSSSTPHLSFHTKNFTYKTVPFHSFISAASSGSSVYMRALSTSNSSKPAALCADYPSLAADFLLPKALDFASQFQHSSVLRISGNVNLWLHYDVMSNILCQISGSKRILLFPPSSVSLLDFPAGQTTSNLDVFAADPNTVRLANCAPLETTLSAGEILFIPACWPHATTPAPQHPGQGKGDLSVAVNVFFRSFEDRLYAAGRDVYGNRDLEMYQNGRKHVAKICDSISASSVENVSQAIKALAEKLRAGERVVEDEVGGREVNRIIASAKDVPDTIANFYLTRLADELLEARRS